MKSLKNYLGAIFCVLLTVQAYSQSTTSSNTFIPGDFIGYNATSNDLFFRTNNFNRGVLKDVTGFWGIGTNFLNPNQLLTVNAGNINVQNITTGVNNNGYMIGNVMTVWRGSAGNVSNIFVGANAGTGNSAGLNNTFVGNLSGFGNSVGSNNTFVGYLSGFVNDGANDNTFLGYSAGRFNNGPTSIRNTYVGSEAGFTNTGSTNNTYVGYRSGYLGTGLPCKENTLVGGRAGFSNQGTGQTFIGFEAGFNQSSAAVSGNTFIGHTSGWSNLSGGENTFVGFRSGYTNTASTNTFIGFRCGEFNTVGVSNAFLGSFAGNANVSGSANTFVGTTSGRSNLTGFNNSYTGTSSGFSNTSGSSNTFNGYVSGYNNINGVKNTFLGDSAGYSNIGGGGLLGSYNTFVGYVAGALNTNGRGNTFTGDSAGYFNNGNFNTFNGLRSGVRTTTGSGNAFYGKESGYLNTTGQLNVYVGSHCGFGADVGNQNTAIGEAAASNNKLGNNNVFAGFESGYNTGVFVADDNNVAVGMQSGYNQRGSNNTYVGAFADEPTSISLTNAAAIGSHALVKSNNKMILGDTNVWVGIGLSNDNSTTLGPGNSLEINARTNTTGAIIPNTSGLRFRQLPGVATSIIAVNPGPGVLALSVTGDVIYVPATSGGSPFFNCGNPVAADQLTNDSWWELNNHNFVFSGTGSAASVDNVGIGTNCSPGAKLDVFRSSSTTGTIGIQVINTDPSASQIVGSSIGIKSTMPFINDPYRIAGYFSSPQLPGTTGTAIYVPVNGGNVVIGYPSLNTAGAKLEVNGNIYAFGTLYPSDQTLKTNVQTITNASSIIYNLRPVSYEWNTSIIADSTMYGTHYGFIAQEVDTVLPSIVHEDHNGIKSVSYTEVIPYLVAALKAEHFRNDSLATALANLTATVNGCCNSNARTQNPNLNQTDVTLTNSESVVLNQNVPNPFAEQTTITYNLPESVHKAQLLFYDATGKLIKSVDLTARGNGQINVFANDLSNGIYSYALVVDGQIADTKRMVKTN